MDITWLDIWKFHGTASLAGCVIDWIIRDPVWLPHPVRLMGTMIAGTKSRFREWTEGTGRKGQSRVGVILAVFMCIIWWCVPWAIVHGTEHLWLPGVWAVLLLVEGSSCSLMLVARGLYIESMKVYRSLKKGGIEGARYNVSVIAGRDTAALDEGGIARAAVETVAENASDGVVASFLFMALLGSAGGMLYKAVNTMDPMVGYKNDRYMYFGHCAARLDDLPNLAPAKPIGILMIPGAWVLPGMDGAHTLKVLLRDRKRHASSNSVHGEAACAGALHFRLVGDAWYFGTLHRKPYIGDNDRQVQPVDVRRTNRLMSFAEGMMVFGLVVLIMIL